MAKSLEKYFADWESHVFGFGYGSGERPVMRSLKMFFSAVGDERGPNSYEYKRLEGACGDSIAWLLINTLADNDIIEYGTSPRYGWLTKEGEQLKAFLDSKNVDELVDVVCNLDEENDYCWPGGCNCGPNGHEAGKIFCNNPFWKRRLP